jgi:hypothetical protein
MKITILMSAFVLCAMSGSAFADLAALPKTSATIGNPMFQQATGWCKDASGENVTPSYSSQAFCTNDATGSPLQWMTSTPPSPVIDPVSNGAGLVMGSSGQSNAKADAATGTSVSASSTADGASATNPSTTTNATAADSSGSTTSPFTGAAANIDTNQITAFHPQAAGPTAATNPDSVSIPPTTEPIPFLAGQGPSANQDAQAPAVASSDNATDGTSGSGNAVTSQGNFPTTMSNTGSPFSDYIGSGRSASAPSPAVTQATKVTQDSSNTTALNSVPNCAQLSDGLTVDDQCTSSSTTCGVVSKKNKSSNRVCNMQGQLANKDQKIFMMNTNPNNYGGLYGGADKTTTEAANVAGKVVISASDQLGVMQTNNAGASASAQLISQGVTATQEAAAQAQAKTLDAAASAATTGAMVDTGVAAIQMYRSYAHLSSIKAVNKTALLATDGNTRVTNQAQDTVYTSAVQACAASATTDPTCVTRAEQAYNSRVDNNQANEIAAQKKAAMTEAMTAAGTTMSAVNKYMQASADRAAAQNALAAGATGFAFSPGTGSGYTTDGTDPDATPVPGQNVDTGPATGDGLASAPQVNPGLNGDPNGGAAGGFTAAAPDSGAGGAGGQMGSASGTTAAKDDPANKDNTLASKSEVGKYTGNDPSTGYVKNQGGGTGMGIDSAFADMMKNLLPGDKDKDKKGDGGLDFGSRSPASDSAAVIARNKNIFEEIHKRYEKKNTEGAIVF